MGSTSTVRIPYVEPTDLLVNYPAADKAKADRLEALLFDTGWINLTPTAGTGTLRYRVKGGYVNMTGSISGLPSTSPGGNVIVLAPGILPAAYRPGSAIYCAAGVGGANVSSLVVNVDGTVQQWNSTSSNLTISRFSATWPIEAKA